MNDRPARIRADLAAYDGLIRRRLTVLAGLAVLLVLSCLLDMATGSARLPVRVLVEAVVRPEAIDERTRVIVWHLRLPVALMAAVTGAALGTAGAAMQTILDNPLASPYTLGVSAAAGFGAALAYVLGLGILPLGETLLVPVNAFGFALLGCFFVYVLARLKNAAMETIVLAGVASMFLFSSLTATLQFIASPEQLQAIVFWLFGSLMKATWPKLAIIASALTIALVLLLKNCWSLTALRLGEEKARSLGVDTERLRLLTLGVVSLLTATAVCFVGTIGFIGLAAPHVARTLVGEDHRFLLPVSALFGATLLSASSILSKLIVTGFIFPVGVITSQIGVLFFIWIIVVKKQRY